MTGHIDNAGDKLKKGFYFDYSDVDTLLYFTGNYNPSGFPEFDKIDGKKVYLPPSLTPFLTALTNKEVKDKIKKLKGKTSWLEERLKE